MKLRKVVNALPALQKLAGENLTPKTLYWVSKLLSKLDKEIEFFNSTRNKLVADLGEEVDGKIQVAAENIPIFQKKIAEILDIDIEAEFSAAKIPTTENLKMSYNDLCLLDGFVELEFVDEERKSEV